MRRDFMAGGVPAVPGAAAAPLPAVAGPPAAPPSGIQGHLVALYNRAKPTLEWVVNALRIILIVAVIFTALLALSFVATAGLLHFFPTMTAVVLAMKLMYVALLGGAVMLLFKEDSKEKEPIP